MTKFIYTPFINIKNQALSLVDSRDLKKTVEPSAVVIGGADEIGVPELDLRKVERLLYLHPVIPRGIEIKANRMVGRQYSLEEGSDEYTEYCKTILQNSGDVVFLKRLIEGAYGFGNGYAELVPNKNNTEILKACLTHPIYFGYAKSRKLQEPRSDINPADKLYLQYDDNGDPVGFQQYRYIANRQEPYGKIIPRDRVLHLAFDVWGDEIEGIPIIKYVQNILNYILNIEASAAEAGYRSANPRYAFSTNIKTYDDLQSFAAQVSSINERDSIIMTEGNKVDVLNPGTTNFAEYHDRFINLLAIRLGIPKPLLLMDGTSTNKATLREQTDFIRNENSADEEIVKQAIYTQLFIPACKLKYGKSFDITKVPKFKFNEYVDSEDTIVERLKEQSLAIVNLTNAGIQLLKNGLYEESKNVFALIPKINDFDSANANKEIETFINKSDTQSSSSEIPVATNQNATSSMDDVIGKNGISRANIQDKTKNN